MSDGTAGMTGLPGLPEPAATPHRGLAAALAFGIEAALLATMVAVPAALWSRLPRVPPGSSVRSARRSGHPGASRAGVPST